MTRPFVQNCYRREYEVKYGIFRRKPALNGVSAEMRAMAVDVVGSKDTAAPASANDSSSD